MLAVQSIVGEIVELKQERRLILARHYQDSVIQEVADAMGDSLSWPATRRSSTAM
jgi:quinolinate synthase